MTCLTKFIFKGNLLKNKLLTTISISFLWWLYFLFHGEKGIDFSSDVYTVQLASVHFLLGYGIYQGIVLGGFLPVIL